MRAAICILWCVESGYSLQVYSNPPHRRNRYFRVVETALVLETAVLETRGFLNAARTPPRTHPHPSRGPPVLNSPLGEHPPSRHTHPMTSTSTSPSTSPSQAASVPQVLPPSTVSLHSASAHISSLFSLSPPAACPRRPRSMSPALHPRGPRTQSPPPPSCSPLRAHSSSTHHWSTPWVRGESSHATRPFSSPPVCLAV